jgi:hypothetical protein
LGKVDNLPQRAYIEDGGTGARKMAGIDEYSTEDLLRMAMNMLHVAKEEQLKSKRKKKWLVNNRTLEVID